MVSNPFLQAIDLQIRLPRSNRPLCQLALAGLVIGLLGASVHAQTVYVDANATGPTHNGSSWCSAYQVLQDALVPAIGGETIRVANGTYAPDQGGGQTPGDRSATFQLVNDVTVEGGYAGCGGPNPDQRDIALYTTTLSGDLSGDDAPGFQNYEENSLHVVTGGGTDATAVLDGFTVRGGNANGGPAGPSDQYGGGVFSYSGSPTIIRCTLVANSGLSAEGLDGYRGSAMTLNESRVTDSTILESGSGLTLTDSVLEADVCLGISSFLEGSGRIGNPLTVWSGSSVHANLEGQTLEIEAGLANSIGGLLKASNDGTLLIGADVQYGEAELEADHGTIHLGEDVVIMAAPVEIKAAGLLASEPAVAETSTAAIYAQTLTVHDSQPGGLPGRVNLGGGMSLAIAGLGGSSKSAASNGGDLVLSGAAAAPDTSSTPPILTIRGAANVEVSGDFIIDGSAIIQYDSELPLLLEGSFDNQSVRPEGFDWHDGKVVLVAGASPQPGRFVEAAGRNDGIPAMLEAEYEFGALELEAGTDILVVDSFDNDQTGQSPCTEVLYVDELILQSGATLTVNDTGLYYNTLVDEGATINLVGCGLLMQNPAVKWTAYNDLSWYDGQLSTNITKITSPANEAGLPSSGELIDYDTGVGTGFTLTVTGGDHLSAIQGAEATTGDAFDIFNGIVSTLGVISYVDQPSPAGDLVLTLSGLDPGTTYELVVHGDRSAYGWDRAALMTLSDVDAFTNASSSPADNPADPEGDLFDGPTDDSTRLPSQNPSGYVARFRHIEPGSDGDLTLIVSPDGLDNRGKYVSALMLRGPSVECEGDEDCDDGNDCTDDSCNLVTERCEFAANDGNSCTDGVDCTDDECSGGNCNSTDNCPGGQVCNTITGDCETPQVVAPGDVIVAGFQGTNAVGSQNPAEFISLFNTTESVISLEGLAIITRAGSSTTPDWTLTVDSAPDLTGASIQPQSFFLIAESGVAAPGSVHDLEIDMNLATAEGGSDPVDTAIGIEVGIDGVVVDNVLYGRRDGTGTGDNAPGDIFFDGVSFPRNEVIRSTTGNNTFVEGVVQRLTDVDLYAGYDVEGFYSDEDTLGSGLPNGVWTSPHSTAVDTYEARNSQSPSVPPPTGDPCDSASDCDDDNVCNGLETCPAGFCVAGTPLNCDDVNPCTDDSCDAATGCHNDPNTVPCDDGDVCTFGDVCSGGFCSGTTISCDDGVDCTDDSCDSVLGCQNVNNCPAGEACNPISGVCETEPLPIGVGDEWRYFKGTQEPSPYNPTLAEWAQPGFDDATWPEGATGIGYDYYAETGGTNGNGDYEPFIATQLEDMRGCTPVDPPLCNDPGYVSIYMRREFYVTNAVNMTSLTLQMYADDGYVAYLNGVEVARLRVPGVAGTPPTFDTLATGSVTGTPPVNHTVDLTAAIGLLVPGVNVLAVQGHNAQLNSRDMLMIPQLESTEAAPWLPILAGDDWRYFKGTEEPTPTDLALWATVGFDDATWSEGVTGIGYDHYTETGGTNGNGDYEPFIATQLNDMRGCTPVFPPFCNDPGYVSVYMRKTFYIANPALVTSLTLRMYADDGYVAYLNGTEVARLRMPGTEGSPPTFDTLAQGQVTGTPPVNHTVDLTADIGLLVSGINVLAVQGHNATLSSRDLLMIPQFESTEDAPCLSNDDCDDELVCTLDVCQTGGVCTHDPGGTEIVFEHTMHASGYCAVDPMLACLDPTDCPSGSCNKVAFLWPEPLPFDFVVGSFTGSADFATYPVVDSGGLDDTGFSHGADPASETGFWYLVRPDCTVAASWQTTPGAEPARDTWLP